jgi:signal transduction histidine kinase
MRNSFQRALIARQGALFIGVFGLIWLQPPLQRTAGPLLAGIVGVCALLNGLLWGLERLPALSRSCHILAPAVGLLGWGGLVMFTRGIESPLLVGFFFEIGLSAVVMGPTGVVWVTLGAMAMLSGAQSFYFRSVGRDLLLFEVGFLAVLGAVAFAIARRRVLGEAAMREQVQELGRRLEALQRELEDERVVARVGENVARLAHGLKNTVHSLRGFVGLIEPRSEKETTSGAAMDGLRSAIDDLEGLARLTLSEGAPAERAAASGTSAAAEASTERTRVEVALDDAREEVERASPGVAWELTEPGGRQATWVGVARTTLVELLIILMRNAVEAMEGEGRARIVLERSGGRCRLSVQDEGVGLDPEVVSRIFEPGYTTKEKGSGFGLFLARRILHDHGGELTLEQAPGGGALVRIELPIVPAPEAGASARADRGVDPSS